LFNASRIAIAFAVAAFAMWSAASRAGDEVETVSYKTLLSRNVTNLNKLSLGMTKAEVIKVMGTFSSETHDSVVPNPYKTEPFLVGKTQYEALYYLTRKYPPFTSIKVTQATPVVLRDGKVIGWSTDTLRAAKAGKFEK